jgi:hypothetical protein
MKEFEENIQYFLNKYKTEINNKNLSFTFRSNPNIHVIESQLPDLWLKTRKPFNRNACFYSEKEENRTENTYPK